MLHLVLQVSPFHTLYRMREVGGRGWVRTSHTTTLSSVKLKIIYSFLSSLFFFNLYIFRQSSVPYLNGISSPSIRHVNVSSNSPPAYQSLAHLLGIVPFNHWTISPSSPLGIVQPSSLFQLYVRYPTNHHILSYF